MIRNLSAYRTPDEVFYDPAIRMPIRTPDASFAFLFFDLVKGGRIVGPNGILHEGRTYRLSSLEKHLEYFAERVDVRVNPDDQRTAMIFDRRTGAFVCRASVDEQDATYDSRDEVTRRLIARVFSDGKELLRMARAHVEGAAERLTEYRRAKIEYLKQRARETRADRERRKAALSEAPSVAVISSFSGLAHEAAAVEPIELTTELLEEILRTDEDAQTQGAQDDRRDDLDQPLCAVSTRPRRASKARSGRRRHDGALRYKDIAARLGIARNTLVRYRSGKLPWPEGMKERFEAYERLREQLPSDAATDALPPNPAAETKPRRTRGDGELSWRSIAKTLGMSLKSLGKCKAGKRSWPDDRTRERFEELERRRSEK